MSIDIKSIYKLVEGLSVSDQKRLNMLLSESLSTATNPIFTALENNCDVKCTHCGSDKVYKNGTFKGRQRYVCNTCTKSFRNTTGTCVQGIHKIEIWDKYIEYFLESKSVRKISKELGISFQTVMNWRHKLLSSFENVYTKQFKGIVEMDDILIRFNQKGRRVNNGFIEESRRTSCYINSYGNPVSKKIKGNRKRGISNDQVSVLLNIDRYGTVGMGKIRRGKMTKKSLERVINKSFKDRLNKNNTVVTDDARSYVSVLNGLNLDHEQINAGRKEWVNGRYHLNTLNNRDRQYKDWIRTNFSSVSTKYLKNYLNYFKMIFFVINESMDKVKDMLSLCINDRKTQTTFTNIESQYQEFLTY